MPHNMTHIILMKIILPGVLGSYGSFNVRCEGLGEVTGSVKRKVEVSFVLSY